MTKYFCDQCGTELGKGDHQRLCRKDGRIVAEVSVAVDGVWNSGHVCHGCILKMFTKGKKSGGKR